MIIHVFILSSAVQMYEFSYIHFHIIKNICTPLIFQNPAQAYGLAFIFSITGYLGITFVLTLIKAFGALLAVTGKAWLH